MSRAPGPTTRPLHALGILVALAALGAPGVPGGAPARPGQAAQAPARRPRPHYEQVLAANARAKDPATLRGALAEMAELERALEKQLYGLDEPLDADRVLASAALLSALPRQPERGEALHHLLTEVERHLDSSARPNPDLALALAHGWPALLRTYVAVELQLDERLRSLVFALERATAIDPADGRDVLGCRLVEVLHAELVDAGRLEQATQALETWLPSFPDDLALRPFLLSRAADERRLQHAWNPAWRHLYAAEEALTRILAQPGADAPVLRRTLAGVRCQLELASGLVDQAVESVERERVAVQDGATDGASRLSLLLDSSAVALVSAQPTVLRRARSDLEAALTDPKLFADAPGRRAKVHARLAVVRELQASVEPGSEPDATLVLRDALAQPELEDVDRAMLVLRLTGLAFRAGDSSAAARWLAHLDPGAPGAPARLPPEYAAAATAWRARLGLARGVERGQLERHEREVGLCYEDFLDSWADRPERAGGIGPLVLHSRRLLLGVLVELGLALGRGEEHVVDLLLREQAGGSLARRLEAPAGSVAAVRTQLLPAGIGLLLYLPGDTSTHLFVVDDEHLAHVEIPWRYEQETAPRALVRLLLTSPASLSGRERDAHAAEIAGLASELTRRLLPELAQVRLATWKGLYVVGADLLGGIPFELLRAGGRDLGTTRSLAYLPSVPVGLKLAERRRAAARDELALLLVAAPQGPGAPDEDGRASGARMPFSISKEDERALLAGYERATVLSGAEATRAGFVAALGRDRPTVLHFLVHGVSALERELTGGLALAVGEGDPQGILWCEDVLDGGWDSPEIVLLSSCGSARGPRRMGDDGLAQLGGAFLARGALCTVQAASDIALAPTLRLMAGVGPALAGGASLAEALRSVRAELAREPGLAQPFYVQSMRVVGLGHEPVVTR